MRRTLLKQLLSFTIFSCASIKTSADKSYRSDCINDPHYEHNLDPTITCTSIRYNAEHRQQHCQDVNMQIHCPISCGLCCDDDPTFLFNTPNHGDVGCAFIAEIKTRQRLWCGQIKNREVVRYKCSLSCDACEDLVVPKTRLLISTASQPTSLLPTVKPSLSSNDNLCVNNNDFRIDGKEEKSCDWVRKNERRRTKHCGKEDVHTNCPVSCGLCCEDNIFFTFNTNTGETKDCAWIAKKRNPRANTYCTTEKNGKIMQNCPSACDIGKKYISLKRRTSPSISATPSSVPTLSSAPTTCDGSLFSLALQLDYDGEETSWSLNTTNIAILEGGNYTKSVELIEVESCIDVGCYEFIIKDSFGDGICCDRGKGSYNITLDDVVMKESNGTFKNNDTFSFCVTSKPSVTPSSAPSDRPSAIPSIVPSTTTSSVPTLSSAPTTCDGSLFSLALQLDDDGEETSWSLNTTNIAILEGGNYTKSVELIEVESCIDVGCYEFIIKDSFGDGICCNRGKGSYNITLDDVVMKESNGTFKNNDTFSFCVTSKPSVTPSSAPSDIPSNMPSTINPSVAPSTSPSLKPSSRPSAIPSIAPSMSPSNGPSSVPSTTPSLFCSIDDFVGETIQGSGDTIFNGVKRHCYQVTVGINGIFEQDTDSDCSGTFFPLYKVGSFQSTDENTAYFTGGDSCFPNGPNRSGSVKVVQSSTANAISVQFSEPQICVYEVIIEVPLCEPTQRRHHPR